ncbi:MAG: hypothetical protein LUD07_09060 [Clostridiales bacterium]|nr:hypothetical protein [Clostridiales bacterium]
MSRFSNYLKNLLSENNEPIASVARSIHAERTSIHKALSDERVLPYRVVHALANHFYLSPEERREFFRTYDMLIQGEDAWHNRAAVGDLLNHLSSLHFQPSLLHNNLSAPLSSFVVSEGLIEGEYAVRNMIYTLLRQEVHENMNAVFRLFLPSGIDLSAIFMQLWLGGADFHVEQFFWFPTSAHNDYSQNIWMLRQIIPLCLIARDSYHPYYFYEHPSYLSINPLNYYIITPRYLILIAQDQSSAYVHRSNQMIRLYSDYFQELKTNCEPLAFSSSDMTAVLEKYSSFTNPNGSFTLMSQPCFGRYYTPELIAKYLKCGDDCRSSLYEAATRRFSLVQNIDKDFYTVFSENGLQYFAETGILLEMPPEYASAIDPDDRRLLLSQLREDIASGTVIGLIARPSYLHLPDYLFLYADPDGNTIFDTTANYIYGVYYCDIHISEKSICHAFRDFFRSLPGSQLVYSQEDTLRILDETIKKCGGA